MMYNYGYYYSPFHFIGTLIGWFIVILIIVWIVRMSRGRDRHWMNKVHKYGFGHDSAMDLLREKYVKGEITKEEFDRKKKDLSE